MKKRLSGSEITALNKMPIRANDTFDHIALRPRPVGRATATSVTG